MIRFVPDHWLDGLVRPFLMADPVAGLYIEMQAPDWRFGALVVLLLLALASQRRTGLLEPWQWRLLLAFAASFYLWTVVSGNGRYFLWALLLVGPLVVMAARQIKATIALRNTVILGVLALQLWVVSMTFEVNAWSLRPWTHGPGIALANTPLKEEPAVYVTIGTITHSILVPQLHPQSRWTNVGGQHEFVPGTREHRQFRALMDSPLPKYAVVRAARLAMTPDQQPVEHAWVVIRRALDRSGLEPAAPHCTFVPSDMGGSQFHIVNSPPRDRGFWFCPIRTSGERIPEPLDAPLAPELDDVFARIEQRCPRIFPRGNAQTRPNDDGVGRSYNHSDTSIVVNPLGYVYFKHMRALNPSVLGHVDEVRAGRFEIDCDRIPGRYVPPWARS
ncbi:MAG: hypothetical protein MUF55_01455 [Hydrogenophaga sp.]|nr:hypothetical protein [Hydrogenophaga sp.]